MKIMINYNLLDKVREAKTGLSLDKIKSRVLGCSSLALPVFAIDNILGTEPPVEFLGDIAFCLIYYSLYYGLTLKLFPGDTKEKAERDLTALSYKLKDIFVDTDAELLKDSICYKTEYEVNFKDSTLPRIEQKKYLTVPVHSDWDNNTRSLLQEHVIGSREYALSHGEPKEQKVYSLGCKKMMQK